MPVRRRTAKRRAGADYTAWCDAFEFSHDFFGSMAEAGIPVDAYGRPDRRAVANAWRIYGRQFMTEWRSRQQHPENEGPWALTEFGPPRN